MDPQGTTLVKITHSGICGTDEHFKHVDMVLGHEGIGTVQEIGERVSQFKVGDVVGWGYVHKTCGEASNACLVRLHVRNFSLISLLILRGPLALRHLGRVIPLQSSGRPRTRARRPAHVRRRDRLSSD